MVIKEEESNDLVDLFVQAKEIIHQLELKLQHLQDKQHQLDLILASLLQTTATNQNEFPLEILPQQPGFIPKSVELDEIIKKLAETLPKPEVITQESIPNLPENSIGILLHNVMSKEEIFKVISFCEENSEMMIPASQQKNYRNCDRIEIVSKTFASFLWERLRHSQIGNLFHETIENASERCFDQTNAVDLEGSWKACGLNELIRIIKYPSHGHFSPHYDGHYVFDRNHRTFLTCMMYLTDQFEGGATEFLSASVNLTQQEKENPILSTSVTATIQPKAGTCIVFSHHLLHQGGQVSEQNMIENKWILRTEVCFERISAPERPITQTRALELLERARVAENHQDYETAQELYRAAFKLYPELNQIIK
jgi:hypothetical protein